MAINYSGQRGNAQQTKKSNPVVTIIICGLLALLFVGFGIINLIAHADYYFGEAENIDDMLANGGVVSGEYVSIGVDAVFDWYAETTHRVNGIPTGKEQHCIVWLSNGDVMSLTVKGKDNYAKIDEIIDQTWAAIDDDTGSTGLHTPVVFEGKITSVGYEVKQYYDQYISDMKNAGFFDYGTTYYELTIDTTDNKASMVKWYILGALFVALMIFVIVTTAKDMKKAKLAKTAGYDANAYNQLNQGAQNNAFTNDAYSNGSNFSEVMNNDGFNNTYNAGSYDNNINQNNIYNSDNSDNNIGVDNSTDINNNGNSSNSGGFTLKP